MTLPRHPTQTVDSAELRVFFADAERRLLMAGPAAPRAGIAELRQFFCDAEFRLKLAIASQREIDRKLATAFNVFHLIEPDENKLSDILADLLNPAGKHGQGDLFLRRLFAQLGLNPARNLTDITTVRREAPTGSIAKYRRRIDILVDAGALIGIENKVDAGEQPDQAKDYLEYLRRSARQRNVDGALIYLSPARTRPSSVADADAGSVPPRVTLRCWSYQKEIRDWLRDCRGCCEAPKIRDFLSDFTDYIESTLGPEWAAESPSDED